jgi:hypothetical protein
VMAEPPAAVSTRWPCARRSQPDGPLEKPDEDEKRWEARLKAVAKPPAKPTKKGK